MSQCIILGALEGVILRGKEKQREKPESNIGCVGRELGALVESQGVALGVVGGELRALRVGTKRYWKNWDGRRARSGSQGVMLGVKWEH